MVYKQKPKLSYSKQIEHLKAKGIQFDDMSETDALSYLRKNNYLFKLSAYRKNYPKDKHTNKYIHLDFAALVDLAVIDMYLRSLVLQLSLNVEHFAKVKLLERITNNDSEDGYSIVNDYIQHLPIKEKDHITQELERNASGPYCSQAYNKYKGHYPIWVFIEIISFGSFLSFYKFCIDRLLMNDERELDRVKKDCHIRRILLSESPDAQHYKGLVKEDKILRSNFYIFLSIKRIRNASAHNNCIINDLHINSSPRRKNPDTRMVQKLREIGISNLTLKNKLANERILEIVSVLYAHKTVVTSSGVNKHLSIELHEFTSRLFKYRNYSENELVQSTFRMLSQIIDKWFPIE